MIRKALQAPKHRYQTVAELSAAIDEAVQGTKAAEVSKLVWRSEGGEKLLGSLRALDSTINERVAEGVNWLNESLKRDQQPKPQPKPDPAPPPRAPEPVGNDGAPKNTTKRNLLIGGGAVVVLGVVHAVLEQESEPPRPPDPNPDPKPDPDPLPDPDPDPDPDPEVPDIGGAWRMEGGATFTVSQSGDYIDGTGQAGAWGFVQISGPIDGPIEIFSETYGQTVGLMTGGLGPRSGGIPGYDWSGTVTDLSTGVQYPILFHINH